MIKNEIKSFSFLVVSYNHEEYILEHLESIKFLVNTYGKGIDVSIIINDDDSNDNTVQLVEGWLLLNNNLFHKVVKIFNNINLGTCQSIINMLEKVDTEYAKLTAGDDVYSYENIFSLTRFLNQGPIVSGLPLDLRDRILTKRLSDIKMIISSYYIYKDKPLIERFKWPSNNNAPNIVYDLDLLTSANVVKYLSKFDVVEDWPIQIAISKNYTKGKYTLVDKVYTYYRRTSNSTYIVANKRFKEDQVKIYLDLINSEMNFISKLMLKNRLYCFNINNMFNKRLLNISVYNYAYNYIININKINKHYDNLNIDIEKHKDHYNNIVILSMEAKKLIS